jgi:nucleotide-binding universal stress UspA family protein
VFKDILFTVDLQHAVSWRRALPVALDLAQRSGARLHVMTVVPEVAVPALMQAGPFDYEAQLVP